MPISITIVGAKEVAAKFAAMPNKLHQELLKTITSLSLDLQQHVVQDKLQGQVLNHITGRLASSIHADLPPKQTADSIIGRVYSAGCNYAAIHEFGFSGAETVREHIRTHVFGREVAPFTVPSFTRTMNMPERSFLRSSLKDMEPQIISELQAAVARGTA